MPPRVVTHHIDGFTFTLSRSTNQLEIVSADSVDEMLVIEADELCALALFLRIPHVIAMVDEMSARAYEGSPGSSYGYSTEDDEYPRPRVAFTAEGEPIKQQPGESYQSWVARCQSAGVEIQLDQTES